MIGTVALLCLGVAAVMPARAASLNRSFACANGQKFAVAVADGTASVRTANAAFQLPRKTSSIGIKFVSPSTTLIMDHDFASLVGRDLPRFERCYATSPLANLR